MICSQTSLFSTYTDAINRLYGKLKFNNVLKEIETSLFVRCSDYARAEMINLATNYNFGVLKEDALLHFSFTSIFGLHNNWPGSATVIPTTSI